MNKWIKLSNLPNDFWGDAFVAWKDNLTQDIGDFDRIVTIKKTSKVEWYSEILCEWFEFRGEHEYLVMPIEYPKVTEEDFK